MKFYLRRLKRLVIRIFKMFFQQKKLIIKTNKDKIFVMLSATYNNLGDIAITLSQMKFLKDINGDKYEIVEIPVEDTYKCYFSIKKYITNNSIITLIGGGNDGSLYDFIEEPRLFILSKFRNNKIISFPQSVFFENTKQGNYYLNKYRKIVSKCSDYTIFTREKKSYERYLSYNLKADIKLSPDIVFYYDRGNNKNRDGIILIMRNDKEKLIGSTLENNIINFLESKNIDIEIKDTCSISLNNNRDKVLDDYCSELLKRKLVITDRLHGMILAYITNTPCIVFNNNNDKIKSTYNTWLSEQNFIYLVEDNEIDLIKDKIQELYGLDKIKKKDITKEYDLLIKKIEGDEK